ncbi:MAG: hypothetical protein WD576_00845 [Nitriliruptoraceae bacterium]
MPVDRLASIAFAISAGTGVFLLYTALVYGRRELGLVKFAPSRTLAARMRDLRVQAGLSGMRPIEFVAASTLAGACGAALGHAVFGGWIAAPVLAAVTTPLPVLAARTARRRHMELAQQAWPRLIEHIRLQVVSVGRSVPQALFEAGSHGPEVMQRAFTAAKRQWDMSADFDQALDVLKAELADPTADAVCETLLVAHAVGGADVDIRLRALADDRIRDAHARKDARAKQAGVRFARLFVLLAPFGMALVGLAIGEGRDAYATTTGQAAVVVAFALIGACWLWAGHLLKLPVDGRVFVELRGRS